MPESKQKTSIKIDKELWKKVKIRAIEEGMKLGQFLEHLLKKELEKKDA